MTVKFNKEIAYFSTQDVLWSSSKLVKAIVREALSNQTEALVEMIGDCQSDMQADELTRVGLQAGLNDVKATTADFLEDVLSDLKAIVLKELQVANYGAIVTGIKYDLAGDITDIEVDVTVD